MPALQADVQAQAWWQLAVCSTTAMQPVSYTVASDHWKWVMQILAPHTFARQPAATYTPGPKACAQCGTTRTPQWREGPEGKLLAVEADALLHEFVALPC